MHWEDKECSDKDGVKRQCVKDDKGCQREVEGREEKMQRILKEKKEQE